MGNGPDLRVLLLGDRAPDARGLGGTQIHAAALRDGSPRATTVVAAFPARERLVIEAAGSRLLAELPIGAAPRDPLAPWPAFARALEAALIGFDVHVLAIETPKLAPRELAAVIARTGVRTTITLHDHGLVCENHELLELGRRYCDLPSERARCDRCLLETRGREAGYLERWRAVQAALLERCDAVVAPSDSVLETVARVFPAIALRARRIDWGVATAGTRSAPGIAGERPLRIAVVGVLARVKGAERLPELIGACAGLDVEWHLFGASEGRSLQAIRRAAPRVVVHGAYSRAKLARRLITARCQLGLLPSIVPESFSLTLSELAGCGIPVIASNLGAQRERVSAQGLGWTFDPWQPAELAELLRQLLADPARIARCMERLAALPHHDEGAMLDAHAGLWRELASRGRRIEPAPEVVVAARERWARAAPRPRHPVVTALERGVAALRRSDWYRDLALRGLVPERWRARAEQWFRGRVKNGD